MILKVCVPLPARISLGNKGMLGMKLSLSSRTICDYVKYANSMVCGIIPAIVVFD
jgi:hypothetical protein